MAKYRATDLTIKIGESGIGQVTALGTVGSTRGLIDASQYNADFKDWLLDQEDGDVVQVDVAYDPEAGGLGAVKDAYDGKDEKTYHFAHEESGFGCHFPALVTGFNRGGAIAGVFAASFTLKIVAPGIEEEEGSVSIGAGTGYGEEESS